jgi:phosphoserine aminotransferase
MSHRVFNFNPGPAILPAPVLEKAAAAVRELPGTGMSVLEISHRGKDYTAINQETQERFARLAGIEGSHKVLLLQGGASLQFAMVPMNLMEPGGSADYIVTGSWAKKAVAEGNRRGTARIAATSEDANFAYVPEANSLDLDPEAAYLHYTSNNTIFGTQFSYQPDAGDVPLVVDTSSDMFSRRMDFAAHGLIYAGAQKNLGPAGVTLVAIRTDLLGRSPKELPAVLSYAVQAEKDSAYNTPPVFSVFVVKLVLEWIQENGGLEAVEARNREKANLLYAAIDGSGFYRGTAREDSRSPMNVTFRLPSEEHEKRFLDRATAAGLIGLKGHRSVGGCRASLYNAFPKEGVEALVAFMAEFERENG